jgi:hypothetical protein
MQPKQRSSRLIDEVIHALFPLRPSDLSRFQLENNFNILVREDNVILRREGDDALKTKFDWFAILAAPNIAIGEHML